MLAAMLHGEHTGQAVSTACDEVFSSNGDATLAHMLPRLDP
jgi:hypothetical protein